MAQALQIVFEHWCLTTFWLCIIGASFVAGCAVR